MATHFRKMGRATALPINLLGQATRWLSRTEQEDLIERLIAHIDSMDGDSDLELNGDELDGSLGEDDFHIHDDVMRYPGCPVSDPGGQYDEDDYTGPVPKGEGAGCGISDPDYAVDDVACDVVEADYGDEYSDPEARALHRSRIRRTRCYREYRRYRDWSGQVRSEVAGHHLYYLPSVPTKRQLLKRKRGVPRRPRA